MKRSERIKGNGTFVCQCAMFTHSAARSTWKSWKQLANDQTDPNIAVIQSMIDVWKMAEKLITVAHSVSGLYSCRNKCMQSSFEVGPSQWSRALTLRNLLLCVIPPLSPLMSRHLSAVHYQSKLCCDRQQAAVLSDCHPQNSGVKGPEQFFKWVMGSYMNAPCSVKVWTVLFISDLRFLFFSLCSSRGFEVGGTGQGSEVMSYFCAPITIQLRFNQTLVKSDTHSHTVLMKQISLMFVFNVAFYSFSYEY